jgi:hypothetical protein
MSRCADQPATSSSRPVTAQAVLAACLGVWLTLWVLVASVLVRLHSLEPRSVAVSSVVVLGATVVVVVLALARHWRHQGAGGSSAWLLRARTSAAAVLPAVGALVLSVPQLVTVVQRDDSLVSPTAWYYWLTAQSVADAGGVPASVNEWGETLEAFTFHGGFSAITAFLSVAVDEPGSLLAAQVVRAVTLVVFGYGVWCLCSAWGAGPLPAMGATALALSVDIYAIKLSSLRPEALAYGFAFLATALLLWGLRHRSRWLLASSAVVAVGVSQVHSITSLLAAVLMLGVVIAHLAGLVVDVPVRARFAWSAAYVAVAGVAAVGANLALRGQVSEVGASRGLPPIGPDGTDPTWAFAQLVSGGPPPDDLGRGAPSTGSMLRSSLDASFLGTSDWLLLVVVGATVALGAGLLWRRDSRRSAAGVLLGAVVGMGALLALSWALSLLGSTYVPRRTGFSRLLQLWPVIAVVALAALSGAPGTARAVRWSRALRSAPAAVATGAGLVIFVLATPAVVALGEGQPTREQLTDVASLRLGENDVVLTNAYTQGFVTWWTPGVGLFDGHAPYLERDLLARSNESLSLARAFFAHPARAPFPFDEYDVSWVLVSRRPYALGTSATWPAGPPTRLDRRPDLALVRLTPSLALYAVVQPDGAEPKPRTRPAVARPSVTGRLTFESHQTGTSPDRKRVTSAHPGPRR